MDHDHTLWPKPSVNCFSSAIMCFLSVTYNSLISALMCMFYITLYSMCKSQRLYCCDTFLLARICCKMRVFHYTDNCDESWPCDHLSQGLSPSNFIHNSSAERILWIWVQSCERTCSTKIILGLGKTAKSVQEPIWPRFSSKIWVTMDSSKTGDVPNGCPKLSSSQGHRRSTVKALEIWKSTNVKNCSTQMLGRGVYGSVDFLTAIDLLWWFMCRRFLSHIPRHWE